MIGTSVVRSDAFIKVSGQAVYGVDYQEVNMLHGFILRSPVAAGRITKLDISVALSLAGVRSILTANDQPNEMAGWVLREQRLFASEELRYEGEPIALVVAETYEEAKAAASSILLEIDEWKGVDLVAASSTDARIIHKDWKSYVPTGGPNADYPRHGNLACETKLNAIGVDEAFAVAAKVIEDKFTSNRQYQAYLEPKSALATYLNGRFTIHTASQHPFNVRERVAQFLGVRISSVRVIGKIIGGGFGGKLDSALEPYAALAAKISGFPVKIINTRTEDLLTCPSRENALITMRTALNAEGEMIGRDVVVDMDNGAYSAEMPWLASLPLHILGAIYEIDGPTRITSRLWYTNTAPTGAFRGVGGTYLYMALERHTDNIANSIGMDRLKFRLLHLIGDGAVSHVGQTLPDAGILREGFDEIQKMMSWEETIANLKPFQGVGIASGLWLTNPMPGQATVKLNEDGTVSVITGATENGSGAVTMGITQIVAQELGVDVNDVSVSMPDTDISGYDAGSQGSRTTHIVGRAALDASIEVKRQVLERASNLLEVAAADLQISNGLISVVGTPSISISLGEVATNALWAVGPVAATSSYTTPPIPFDPGCASGLLFPTFPTPTYHVHMAVVEVDPVTGGVKVLRYVVVQEVGKAINPVGVRGQIQGAVAQGIGLTLYESLRIGKDCRYLERTLESYRLPIALDVPDVDIRLMEHPDKSGPFGAKGAAEPAVVFVPAAVLNAVSHAIGRNVTSIPLTPECVLDLIEGKS